MAVGAQEVNAQLFGAKGEGTELLNAVYVEQHVVSAAELTKAGEIGAMAGAILGAAAHVKNVVIDGYISTAAALIACRLCPDATGYIVASHRSVEPGHVRALGALGIAPLLDLDLRLGEGTGAALSIPLVRSAAAILRDMATFSSAGVSGPASGPASEPASEPA